ncbi:LysR family transcriptional regulator [Devosia sp. BK]|uniref:LysR family transcriptional regulator n=1 Tax=Devosia sp. BK TaxID=2871706 RepID=UPI00293BF49B|nr:LysR family transcriptional regulator [Devosia sp. BK]
MDGLTLDQMAIFVTVVEIGSFSGAARRMNRAQSAITYGIQNLEMQTGSNLFDRSGYRPSLTPAGVALLPRAKRILESMAEFRTQAHNLASGMEVRLTIALDITAPHAPFIRALEQFRQNFPMVELNLVTQPMEETVASLRAEHADIAIIADTPVLGKMDDLERKRCGVFQFLAVAAPEHPLSKMGRTLTETDLQDHMQLMLSSGDEATGTTDFSGHGINRWRVNDLSLRHKMLLEGLGWGGMPDHLVAGDIREGCLVALAVDPKNSAQAWPRVPMSVAHLKRRLPGKAGRWLLDRLAQMPNSGFDRQPDSYIQPAILTT